MTAKTRLRIHSIDWDTDGESPDLPTEITIEPEAAGIVDRFTELANFLSDRFGWCVNSLAFEEITPESFQVGMKKFLFLVDAPHPNGEDANLVVVAADAQTARDLYVETVVAEEWFDEEEIAKVAFRVHQMHPLGAEYDASPSRIVAWEGMPQTNFGLEDPEKDDPEP